MKYALKVFYAQTYLNSSRKHSEDSNKSARWIIVLNRNLMQLKNVKDMTF